MKVESQRRFDSAEFMQMLTDEDSLSLPLELGFEDLEKKIHSSGGSGQRPWGVST